MFETWTIPEIEKVIVLRFVTGTILNSRTKCELKEHYKIMFRVLWTVEILGVWTVS